MKKLFALLVTLIWLPLTACAENQYQEGIHYEIIPVATSEKPVIQEFFSYYCGHCYRFEPIMEQFRDKFGDKADVESIHVIYRQGDGHSIAARALATAKLLDIEHKITSTVFDYNFKKHAKITTEKDFKNVFIINGVSGKEFDKAWNSFSVNSKVAQFASETKKAQIRATPNIVINGKYKVKTEWLRDSTDFMQDYIALVDYLLTLK